MKSKTKLPCFAFVEPKVTLQPTCYAACSATEGNAFHASFGSTKAKDATSNFAKHSCKVTLEPKVSVTNNLHLKDACYLTEGRMRSKAWKA